MMKPTIQYRYVSAFILLVLAGNQVMAHHGFGRFDPTTDIELEGTLTDLEFVNPHSYVYFDTVTADGTIVEMGCEMRAATVLRRSGWSPNLFIAGAHIEISGNPHRDDPTSCYVETLAIGEAPFLERYQQLTVNDLAAETERTMHLPDGTPNIFGEWAQEQYLMAQPRAVGARGVLVPKSIVESIESGALDPEQAPGAGWGARPVTLTGAGEAAAEILRNEPPEDNPRISCQITSILFDWVFDGPINRISRGEGIISIEYGRDLVRTISMDLANHLDNIEPSRGGTSIGRWEGDTLVVDTVGFLPGRLAGNVPHSDQLHITERFSLQRDWLNRVSLQRDFQAEDELYFTDQYSGSDSVLDADAPFAVDQCKELAFEYTLEN